MKLDFPIWQIDGDKSITQQANSIASITSQLGEIEKEIIDYNKKIDTTDKRLNMYFENIFGLKNFKQNEHGVYITEKYEVLIYPVDVLMNCESNEDGTVIIDQLPEPIISHKSNKKQTRTILEKLVEFNTLIVKYNEAHDEYKELNAEIEKIWVSVKEDLKKTKFFSVYQEQELHECLESYNEEEHSLVLAQNDNNDWGFKFIRKENEKEFYDYFYEK